MSTLPTTKEFDDLLHGIPKVKQKKILSTLKGQGVINRVGSADPRASLKSLWARTKENKKKVIILAVVVIVIVAVVGVSVWARKYPDGQVMNRMKLLLRAAKRTRRHMAATARDMGKRGWKITAESVQPTKRDATGQVVRRGGKIFRVAEKFADNVESAALATAAAAVVSVVARELDIQ